MRTRWNGWLALLAGTLAIGCTDDPQIGTLGSEGRLDFTAYGPGECAWGCPVERAFAAQATARLAAFGAQGAARVVSDAPEVVAPTLDPDCSCSGAAGSRGVDDGEACAAGETRQCTYGIELAAGQPGRARLRVLDARGALVDAIDVRVAAPVRAEFVRGDEPRALTEELVLARGDKAVLGARFYDGTGALLNLSSGQRYHTSGLSVFDPTCLIDCTGLPTTTLLAVFPGEAVLRVLLGDFEARLDVRVVP
jgi:hypothetical protein